MRNLVQPLLRAFMLFALTACGGKQAANLEEFNIELYTPTHSQGFEILGSANSQSTIVRIFNPWQGAEEVVTQLFISRNGESAPKGFQGEVLEENAERIICMSSSYVAMLDAIDEVERVVGVSGIDFISNEYVRSHSDKIGDVGYDGNINFEMVVALDPDIVLLYGVSAASAMEIKLRELGIPYAYIGEYLEQNPLGKSEWMIALAEMVGKRDKAEEIFAQIPQRYNRLKALAATAKSPKPKVMLNTPYADSWVMASTSSYMARLIADAEAEYIYKRNTSNSSMPIDLEEATRLSAEADVWLNVGTITSLSEMRSQFPKFADIECVRAGEVYNCDKRQSEGQGNDYWESGVVNPDVILRDMIKIFHPELIAEEFVYYRKLE